MPSIGNNNPLEDYQKVQEKFASGAKLSPDDLEKFYRGKDYLGFSKDLNILTAFNALSAKDRNGILTVMQQQGVEDPVIAYKLYTQQLVQSNPAYLAQYEKAKQDTRGMSRGELITLAINTGGVLGMIYHQLAEAKERVLALYKQVFDNEVNKSDDEKFFEKLDAERDKKLQESSARINAGIGSDEGFEDMAFSPPSPVFQLTDPSTPT